MIFKQLDQSLKVYLVNLGKSRHVNVIQLNGGVNKICKTLAS